MAEPVRVRVRLLDPEMSLPSYAHPGDAGADLAIAHDLSLIHISEPTRPY